MLAANRGLADVAGHEVHALDLLDRHLERVGDGGLDEALAQPDAHLARDHLDDEARGPCIDAAQQRLERLRLRRALRGANLVERCGEIFERRILAGGAAFERFARPVTEVRVLAEDGVELALRPRRDLGDDPAQRAPAEA